MNRLQKELKDDFIILNFSVRQELDILNISYIELFIALMKRLFEFANGRNLMRDIIKQRMDISLFGDTDIIYKMIDYSS